MVALVIQAELAARGLTLADVSIRTELLSIRVATGSPGIVTTEIAEGAFAVLDKVYGYESHALTVPPTAQNTYKITSDNESLGFGNHNLHPVFGYFYSVNKPTVTLEAKQHRVLQGAIAISGEGAAAAQFTARIHVVSPRQC